MQKIIDFTKKHIFLLSLIYAGGLFLLNVLRLFNRNFWFDESFSIGLVAKSLPEVIYGTAVDVHPPFYYIILWLACRIFGYTPIVFRAVSLVPLLAIIIIAFTWVKKKFSIHATLILITFACIIQTATVYNVEVRMYSWGSLLMLLSFMAFHGILYTGKTAYYVMFSIATLCAAYTHYYLLIAVAFFYLLLLILGFKKKDADLKRVLILCGVAVLVYLPWLFVLLNAFSQKSGGFWINRVPFPIESLAFIFTDTEKGNPFGFVLAVILFPLIIGFTLFRFNLLSLREKENGRKKLAFSAKDFTYSKEGMWLLSGLLCIYGTIFAGTLVSVIIRPLYITRYIFPMAVIAWLMAGVCISKLKKRTLITVLLIVSVLMVSIPVYAFSLKEEIKENRVFEETHNATADIIGEGDIIFAENIHLTFTVEGAFDGITSFYFPGSRCVHALPDNETEEESSKFSLLLKEYSKPEDNSEYYLFLNGAMTDRYSDILTEQGYSYEEIYLGGDLGTYDVSIYRLIPLN